jgi:selenocysteine-specific elongation factor
MAQSRANLLASLAMSGPTRLVLGTAGHIDHGKTALVQALTGIDCDRLPEEKARGITIELGFAPLDLPGGARLSVVDVPGHERLVRTMVAGASGIDLVLLVVAADEGVMPQTREHLAICEVLGLDRGVVALTKIDAADDDSAAVAEAELRDLLGRSALSKAEIVRVSSRSGAGIDALRERLAVLAADATARTPRNGVPRLGVDRVFTMRGFGTVVTGTLVGGALRVGDELELLPSRRRARVRGLQSHGDAVEVAAPGARTAVNLLGVEVADVARGDLLAAADASLPTLVFDASLQWLANAPPLDQRTSVELLAGTADRRARASPIGAFRIAPGERGFARIHVEGEPLALLPGDRFVLRGFTATHAGGATWGGGVVLDVAPPRRRRSDPALLRDLEALAARDPGTDVAVRVARAGLAGIARDRLRLETGIEHEVLDAMLAVAAKSILVAPAGLCLAAGACADLEHRIESVLSAFHEGEPLRLGMPRGALAGALPGNVAEGAFEFAVARLAAAGRVVDAAEGIRAESHRAGLQGADAQLAERIRTEMRAAGLEPPSLKEWGERLGKPEGALRAIFAHLVREGTLVAAPGAFWFDRSAVDALRDRVVAHLKQHGSVETPAYKSLIGTTRKHAVPLMELFDQERVTLRVGNKRVLRGAK